MPFYVVVTLRVRPDRLPAVLELIRAEFGGAEGPRPGRRRAHVFQRLGDPADLLGCIEWESREAYDAYRQTPVHREILDQLAAPAHARYCERLSAYERMLERSEVAACATIRLGAADPRAVEHFLLQEGRAEVIAAAGLVGRDVYRTLKRPPTYVVVHLWRRLTDLEEFRRDGAMRKERALTALGATVEWFTGPLSAKYPVTDE